MIGDGANHWGLVHVEDIADLDVRALDAPAGTDAIIGVEPGEPDAAARPSRRSIGAVTSSVSAAELGPIGEALALDQRLTSARARTELGWTPRHRLLEAATV